MVRFTSPGSGILLFAVVAALSGCNTSSSGSSATASSATTFQSGFDNVTQRGPTSDMPTTLTGNYVGAISADVTNTTQKVGTIQGDVNLAINWTDGQTTNPFSGTASNFQGTLTGGTSQAISGTLNVDNALPASIMRTSNTIALPTGGSTTVSTGSMMVNLTGQLSDGTQAANTTLQLGGTFFGAGASGASGTAGGLLQSTSATNPGLFDGTIAGTYYLDRQ